MKIKDVIHGEIRINEPLIIDLISTVEFQRLRKVKQLGITNLIFPGAEHTRLSHSLGVYFILGKILKKFSKSDNIFFTQEEKLTLLCSGLLHDLGHGPLSHTSEHFFKYSHEDYTIKIIEDENSEINQVIRKYEKDNNIELLKGLVLLIKKEHPNKALNSLISSSLDADRMDYLMRDSYHTGAVYGRIDIERIIDGIDFYEGELVYEEKSVHTIEDFIMSRYHMFVQVYFNTKSLFYEKLLAKVLKRVFKLYEEGYNFKSNINILLDLAEKPIKVANYLNINDYNFLDLMSSLQKEDDTELKDLLTIYERQSLFNNSEILGEPLIDKQPFLETKTIKKSVYEKEEPIRIKMSDGTITNIENISPILKFAKEDLAIEAKGKYLYLNNED